jgi:hypothetical protein
MHGALVLVDLHNIRGRENELVIKHILFYFMLVYVIWQKNYQLYLNGIETKNVIFYDNLDHFVQVLVDNVKVHNGIVDEILKLSLELNMKLN